MVKTLKLAIMACVFLVLIAEARASQTISYTISNPSGGTSSGYAGLETFNVKIDTTPINGVFAGGIQITETTSPTVAGLPSQYTTICTDINGTLYLGRTYTYDVPVTPFAGQSGVGPSWGADNAPGYSTINQNEADMAIQNAAYLFYHYGGLTSGGMTGTTEHMAALQLAVWEALYNTDSSGKVTGSRFTVSAGSDSTAINDASSWVASMTGNYGYTGYLLYPDPLSQGNNDGEPPQELLIAVPEPTTTIAGALLLLPFGASTLRFIRKNRSFLQ